MRSKDLRQVESRQRFFYSEIVRILYGSAIAARAEPLIRADAQRLRPGVGEQEAQPVRCLLVHRSLQSVIPGFSNTGVVVRDYRIWQRETRLRDQRCRAGCRAQTARSRDLSRPRRKRLVPVDVHVESVTARPYIVHRYSGIRWQRLLHAKVPLIGVRVLQVGIHKPVVLLKRCRRRRCICALQRILCEDGGDAGLIRRDDQLIGAWPRSLLVLRHLNHSGPVVVEAAIPGAKHRGVSQPICHSHSRLNVVVGIWPEASAKRRDNGVCRQRAIRSGNTWRLVAGCGAGGRNEL